MKRECRILLLFLAALLAGCGDDVSANDDENDGAAPTTMTDERDGQVYRIVTIGEQVWMAENLRYEYKVNGAVYGNWCPPDEPFPNESGDCTTKGRLYTWGAAMDSVSTDCGKGMHCSSERDFDDSQSICPNGWRLPGWGDWRKLFGFVGGESVAGTALKASSGWEGNKNGTDAYGFSAFPSVFRNLDGFYQFGRDKACFWVSYDLTDEDAPCALIDFSTEASKMFFNKGMGLAVRCVKDSD